MASIKRYYQCAAAAVDDAGGIIVPAIAQAVITGDGLWKLVTQDDDTAPTTQILAVFGPQELHDAVSADPEATDLGDDYSALPIPTAPTGPSRPDAPTPVTSMNDQTFDGE